MFSPLEQEQDKEMLVLVLFRILEPTQVNKGKQQKRYPHAAGKKYACCNYVSICVKLVKKTYEELLELMIEINEVTVCGTSPQGQLQLYALETNSLSGKFKRETWDMT